MKQPDELVYEANENLDLLGIVTAQGSNIAPDYVMRTVIAMRARLKRHMPRTHDEYGRPRNVCGCCGLPWPCPDVAADFDVLGVTRDAS